MEEKIEEKEIENLKRKNIALIVSLCVVGVLLVVGISYAFWQSTKVQEGEPNIIAGGCFDASLEGKDPINLVNAFPITDEEGEASKPYTFTIKNKCKTKMNYDVALETLSDSTLDSGAIKVMINDTKKLYNGYSETEKLFETSKENRLLVSGTLEAEGTVEYTLRLWIDKDVTQENNQNKKFESKVVVRASLGELHPEINDLTSTKTEDTINLTYKTTGDETVTCKWGIVEGTYDNEVADATKTTCTITGLQPSTTYYYQICNGSKCEIGNDTTSAPTTLETITES